MTHNQRETVFFFLRSYWRLYGVITTFCMIGAILEALHLAILFPILNIILEPASVGAVSGYGSRLNRFFALLPGQDTIVTACFLLIAATIVKNILGVFNEYLIGRASGVILYRTRKDMLENYSHAPYSFFLENKQGDLSYRILMAPAKLSFVLTRIPQLAVEVFRVAAILALLLYANLKAASGLILISILAYFLISRVTRGTSYTLGKGRMEASMAQSSLFNEWVNGIKQISIYGVQERWLALFDQASWKYSSLFIKDSALLVIPKNLIETLAIGCLFGTVAIMHAANPEQLKASLPLAGVFCMALLKLLPSLSALSRCRIEIQGALPDIESIKKTLSMRFAPPQTGMVLFERLSREIRLEGIHFDYPSRDQIFSGLDLTIPAGKTTAIVGDSGSGKTTIVNLLLGLYRPTKGRITIDGTDFLDMDLRSFLDKVALVSQDTCIFHASIADNITFGRPNFSNEQIQWAAKIAHAHDFIARLPDGYDTIVGERGLKLSGGQQQRLAIARAILNKPDIMIFDEATSALDNLSEAAVQEAIWEASRSKTVIQVAHRLSTIQTADKIVVLQNGRIIEEGKHQELIKNQGLYARLAAHSRAHVQ